MSHGHVLLDRSIQEHWLWKKSKKKSWVEAWIDLIQEANSKDGHVCVGNQLIVCKRSETMKSQKTWAKRWGWSRSSVQKYLNLLARDEMISIHKTSTKTTHLKLLNYDTYQAPRSDKRAHKEQKRGTNNILVSNAEGERGGNKGGKTKFGSFGNVLLSPDEFNKVKSKFGEFGAKQKIRILDEGIELKGYKYKNHYLAICKWAEKDARENAPEKKPSEILAEWRAKKQREGVS